MEMKGISFSFILKRIKEGNKNIWTYKTHNSCSVFKREKMKINQILRIKPNQKTFLDKILIFWKGKSVHGVLQLQNGTAHIVDCSINLCLSQGDNK